MSDTPLPHRFGIRREDKSRWERRVPLTPDHVTRLIREHGIACRVQPSTVRAFEDGAYAQAGAELQEDLDGCAVVLAVKEIPVERLRPGTTYLYFSHTIKGQAYNMKMLRRLLDLGCQLIDYERITDEAGRRLVFFGRHAGLAGMIDTLWTLGRRLARRGHETPFRAIRPAHEYADLDAAKDAVRTAGRAIQSQGLPAETGPLVFGFAGYGNVAQGAQEIFDLLPHTEVTPDGLADQPADTPLVKTVFREEHLVAPVDDGAAFDLHDYYDHPERYRSRFDDHLAHLSVLVNCIYWEPRYPRLVTRAALRQLAGSSSGLRLEVIGDITCDVEGSIECTARATGQDDPVYSYHPTDDRFAAGVDGEGVTILAVDNLPCELPHSASISFGDMLMPFLPALACTDFTAELEASGLPAALQRAAVVWRGELTPGYAYLAESLS